MRLITSAKRSRLMARVRRKGTAPELTLRRALWTRGMRYRLHPKLPGSPDIAFLRAKLAVFIDGCFWHCCPTHGSMPKTNRQFWKAKLERNRARDLSVDRELARLSWLAVRIWEHELRYGCASVTSRIKRLVSGRGGRANTAPSSRF